jgi:DNA-binding CsgD family transcriptional regulator
MLLTKPEFYQILMQLPKNDLPLFFEMPNNACISLKTPAHGYSFANHNFIQLMGLNDLSQLMLKKDQDLTRDKTKLAIYRKHDEFVLEEEKPLSVEAIVTPQFHKKLVKVMEGKVFPVAIKGSKPDAILGIFTPKNKLLTINPDEIFDFTLEDLKAGLVNRTYNVNANGYSIAISRQEILCFIELLKGKTANDIAQILQLKQSTVESYLQNLKNKCGVTRKMDLIEFFLTHRLLQQIVI